MTIVEMHTAIDLGLQRISANAFGNFLNGEIDDYLNDSITKYVKAQVSALRNPENAGSQVAHENLRTLVKTNSTALSGHSLPNSYSGALLADFYIYIAALAVEATTNDFYRCDYVTPGEFMNSLPTAKDSPIFSTLPLTFFENAVVIVKDATIVNALSLVHFSYLKTPAIVLLDDGTPGNNVNCDLPAHTHQELVDLSVAVMLEDLYQAGMKKEDAK